MLSCSIWFSAPGFWMGGGLESRCVGRVYGADGAVHGTYCNVQYKAGTMRRSRVSVCLHISNLQPLGGFEGNFV